MPSIYKIKKKIEQPGFYSITEDIKELLKNILQKPEVKKSGIFHIFNLHTSSALTINESWDPTAKRDLEQFFDHLAPEGLPFIEHLLEGPDDSPAHMKTALLHQNIAVLVEEGELLLGKWQGIFLAEFRSTPQERILLCKFQPD
jgi:secondary thiamine-phosphate synthase enzyme